ncbi:uncharacterized protein FYW49_005911 [Xenentodon cancila]
MVLLKRIRSCRYHLWYFLFLLLVIFGKRVLAELRYSIPEEMKEGTAVGNVAKDLGLEKSTLSERRFRIVSEIKDAFFEVNQDNGLLQVIKKIDREELCEGKIACLIELKFLAEDPFEIHYVIVEVTDVNDHSPSFPEKVQQFQIAEHTSPGTRLELHAARDPDEGPNSIRTYTITSNDHFDIEMSKSDEEKVPFLVLKKSLDREQRSKHSLFVTALDGGKPPRSGTLNVSITVLDINDNRPAFSQDNYVIEIFENVPADTTIIKVDATDPDEGTNGEIEYILSKTLARKVYETFELDILSGQIKLKEALDFEESDNYKLDVLATDKGTPPLTNRCRVTVKIKDVNDNAPEIHVTSLSNTVSEDAKPGTVVSLISVKDKDSGLNGKIISHITEDVPFELKPSYKVNTYSVVTKGFLDREEVSHYKIPLQATDCGESPLTTFKILSIQISDVNDNSPQFSHNPLHFYMSENNIAGVSIFAISANDNDMDENAAITYHIVRDNDLTAFLNVNSENGQISALKSFDFETLKTFQFQVVATDSGTPSLSSNVTVNVFILDQNDNAPVILYPVSSNGSAGVEEIPRNVNAGHLVTKVRAYDADIGYNGWLLFSLQEVSDHSLFGLDRYTGQIRTLRSFTETDEAEHKLVVLVKDNGNVSLSATATVVVKLVEPKEAFAASDVKSASKDDDDDNVTFYLMITLGSVSVLFLISIIVLIAMQCSKPTDYTSKYLQETNYDGTLCHSIQYRSGDRRYMLVGPRMSIGSTTVPGSNANTLVLPDRRLASEEFQVVATDSGTPSLSSNVTVNVFILDQNDNAPVILYPVSSNSSAEGVEEIPRNVNAGHLVTKVRAYDADIGYNGWLLFSLQEVSDHSLFGLDRYTGQIRTLRSFTETDEAEHKLVVLVKDNGNVSLSATATVVVKLVEPKEAFAASDVKSASKDDEDNNVTLYLMIILGSVSVLFLISIIVLIAMQCSKSTDYTSKYLQETNYDGTLCHSIQYRSGDRRYMLVGPRMSIGSTIVPGSHANTLVLPDRRKTSEQPHKVKQRRRDSWRQRSAMPGVLVLFLFVRAASAQLKYSISEELREETFVGNIAKDLGIDLPIMRQRGFRIMSSSAEPLFKVNENDGALYSTHQIDREQVCKDSSVCMIRLKTVLENPLEIHYVTVEITDLNDHSPKFPENTKTLEISESALPGAQYQLQNAFDPDGGMNSVQQYKISQNDHFRLEIKDRGRDRKTPILQLQKQLDREIKSRHNLVLTAMDGGTPPKTGTLEIYVEVLDVNDNMPVFTKDTYSAVLQENSPIGTTVIQVNATDMDDGPNGEVEYFFGSDVKDTIRELFDIKADTGEIIVKGHIDYEEQDSYDIDIQASDKGIIQFRTFKSVIVQIGDINDNAPDIEVASLSSHISEDSRPGTTVALLSITDLDAGMNGKITSSVVENSPFTLSPSIQDNMFAVVTKSQLDREKQSRYDVKIIAKDAGEPSLTSEKTIRVEVSDTNDNSPVFLVSPYTFYITENNPSGASVFSVRASDRDEGDNAVITYRIVRNAGDKNKMASFLNINSENGDIVALKSFDFETLKTFQFRVVATDSGTPSLSSNVTVNVFILDQNDNAPVILYPVSSNGSAEGVEEIPRNVNAGHLVTKVRAYDADIGYNGWLLFSLQEVSDHSLFGLDRYTGQIRTLRSFTETDEAEHKLVVLVKDNGNVSLSATATVVVKVVEPKEAFAASDVKSATKDVEDNNVTFYLMITLGSVSVLFLISIIVLIAMQCSKSTDYTSKYLQETNYDGTLCHSIQYRSGDRRYMLVGPRMSIGSTIVPGSHANTLVLPDRRGASEEVRLQSKLFCSLFQGNINYSHCLRFIISTSPYSQS